MPDSNSLIELCAEQTHLAAAIKAETDRHATAIKTLQSRLRDIREQIALHSAGLDMAKIALARSVLYLSGSYRNGGDRRDSVVRDAMHWFATGTKPEACYRGLDQVAYGTKNYDRWSGQRSDHEYGWGPSHGWIVFAVGLKNPRNELTEEQREACLYYLVNIEAIESAQVSAAA